MFLDFGYRSECCVAPIRLGRKKIKGTTLTVNVWVCCNCSKKDVNIIENNKKAPSKSTLSEVDIDEDAVLE